MDPRICSHEPFAYVEDGRERVCCAVCSTPLDDRDGRPLETPALRPPPAARHYAEQRVA